MIPFSFILFFSLSFTLLILPTLSTYSTSFLHTCIVFQCPTLIFYRNQSYLFCTIAAESPLFIEWLILDLSWRLLFRFSKAKFRSYIFVLLSLKFSCLNCILFVFRLQAPSIPWDTLGYFSYFEWMKCKRLKIYHPFILLVLAFPKANL